MMLMEKMIPKISVVIPIYNVKKYLRVCLDSILAQTLKDIEIILIDDGSYDGSEFICDEYAQRDVRIKVIHQKNKGVSASRNIGVKNSSGEYIHFLDSDDWIESSDFYERLYKKIENCHVDCVLFDNDEYNEQTGIRVFKEARQYHSSFYADFDGEILNNEQIRNIIFTILPFPCNKLQKRSLFIEYDLKFPEGLYFEDTAFNLYILYYTRRVLCLKDIGVTYRTNVATSTTNDMGEKYLDSVTIFEVIKKWLVERNEYEKIKTQFIENALICLNNHYVPKIGKKYRKILISKIKKFVLDLNLTEEEEAALDFHLDWGRDLYNLYKKYDISYIYSVFYPKKKSVFRFNFFEIKNKVDKIYIKILGVSVVKILKQGDTKKYYCMGILLFKKYKTNKVRKLSALGLKIYKKRVVDENDENHIYVRTLLKKYDFHQKVIFIVQANAGETVWYARNMNVLVKKYPNSVVIITKKYHEFIFKMFAPEIPVYLFDPRQEGVAWALEKDFRYQDKNIELLLSGKFWHIFFAQNEHFYRSFVSWKKIPQDFSIKPVSISTSVEKNVYEKSREINLNWEKFIVISPEAVSQKPLSISFWKGICMSFLQKGYDVFVNTNDPQYLLPGTKNYFFNFEEVYFLIEKSKGIIALRSGLCDIIACAHVDKYVVYTEYDNFGSLLERYTLIKYPGVDLKTVHEYLFSDYTEETLSKELMNKY